MPNSVRSLFRDGLNILLADERCWNPSHPEHHAYVDFVTNAFETVFEEGPDTSESPISAGAEQGPDEIRLDRLRCIVEQDGQGAQVASFITLGQRERSENLLLLFFLKKFGVKIPDERRENKPTLRPRARPSFEVETGPRLDELKDPIKREMEKLEEQKRRRDLEKEMRRKPRGRSGRGPGGGPGFGLG